MAIGRAREELRGTRAHPGTPKPTALDPSPLSANQGGNGPGSETPQHLHNLTEEELDRRIREGWEEWCELSDRLVTTDGMLPSRGLAGWLLAFFEDAYWRAEEAHAEMLRRQREARAPIDRIPDGQTA